MYRPRFVIVCTLCYSLYALPLHAQSVTPTPTVTPIPTPPPWYMVTEGNVPYVILLAIGLIIFIAGTLARPLLEDLANALQRWVRGWGKAGNFYKRYLDWVVAKNRFDRILLPERAVMGMQHRRQAVALEELYTPLALGGERHEPTRDFFNAGPVRQRLHAVRTWLTKLWQRIRPLLKPSAGEIGDLIQAQPHLVIRGDPGSGKTTLLRYLAVSCARTLRRDRADGDDRRLVLRRFGWKKSPFPLIIPLNLLADVGDWGPERRLLDEMIETLDPELRHQYPAGFFERQLEKGHCLVLFDGFDELGSRSARGKMAQLIADLTTGYDHPTNRFVVSTRIVGYEAQLDAYGFTVRTVQELEDQATKLLVERRYRAIALTEGLGRSEQAQADLTRYYAERTRDLLANLARNVGLRELTSNPLLLSLIVLVHSANIKLPDERHLLYRDCVTILTEDWQEFRRTSVGLAPTAAVDGLTLDHKIVLLRTIALTMQQQRQEEQSRASKIDPETSQALIRRDVVEALIAKRLPNFIADELPPEKDKRANLRPAGCGPAG
ncbi:MAG: NACHT domain-containing protein [Caldilineaceae bacterium]